MRISFYIALCVAVLMCLTGCKTTEKNYKAAYDIAAAHARGKTGLDEDVLARVNRGGHISFLIVEGDSLPMVTETIGYTHNGGSDQSLLEIYNVAVGKFKQLFNAQEMRQRLMREGYPAFILHNREPVYYVLTCTVKTPEEALKEFNRVKTDSAVVKKPPFPFILRPAHLVR